MINKCLFKSAFSSGLHCVLGSLTTWKPFFIIVKMVKFIFILSLLVDHKQARCGKEYHR